MKTIVLISLAVYVYTIFKLICELYYYIKYDYNDDKHELKFISIIINLIVLSIGALYWLFAHGGTEHAIQVHLINQKLWLGVLLWSYTVWSITRYSQDYRNNRIKFN